MKSKNLLLTIVPAVWFSLLAQQHANATSAIQKAFNTKIETVNKTEEPTFVSISLEEWKGFYTLLTDFLKKTNGNYSINISRTAKALEEEIKKVWLTVVSGTYSVAMSTDGNFIVSGEFASINGNWVTSWTVTYNTGKAEFTLEHRDADGNKEAEAETQWGSGPIDDTIVGWKYESIRAHQNKEIIKSLEIIGVDLIPSIDENTKFTLEEKDKNIILEINNWVEETNTINFSSSQRKQYLETFTKLINTIERIISDQKQEKTM